MALITIDGFDGVDDVISTPSAGPGDTLVSSTFGGNDYVSPWSAQYEVRFGDGSDTLDGGRQGTAWGGAGDDRLWISAWQGNHVLYGGNDNDDIGAFLGGSGAASVSGYGGNGHDLFTETGASGVVASWFGGSGFDVVRNLGNTPLALVLEGAGSAGGAVGTTYSGVEGADGSGGNDTMVGSRFADLLIGDGGSDILQGEDSNDFLIGESRSVDFINAYRGIKADFTTTDALDPLNCNAAGGWASDFGSTEDSLYGGRGNDVMSGGGGADHLDGGPGRDWATYLSAGSSVSAKLSTGGSLGDAAGDIFVSVENIQGSEFDDTLVGNDSANELRGMRGNDSLSGSSGNDTLVGGEGRDTLVGGGGNDSLTGGAGDEDVFVFRGSASLTSIDTITDMAAGFDEIWLQRSVFVGIGPLGAPLAEGRFASGPAAQDGSDRIIYDPGTGALFYDADGNGAGAAVQFAQLASGLALSASDFLVVS